MNSNHPMPNTNAKVKLNPDQCDCFRVVELKNTNSSSSNDVSPFLNVKVNPKFNQCETCQTSLASQLNQCPLDRPILKKSFVAVSDHIHNYDYILMRNLGVPNYT